MKKKENTTDFEYLPLARVIHSNNILCIDDEYSFPAMRLSANHILRGKVAEIKYILDFYKNKLEEYRYTERKVSDRHFYNFFILCAINRALSLLSSFMNEDSTHPWLYYMALCQFTGKYLPFREWWLQMLELLICHTITMIKFRVSVICSIILR